MSDLSRAELTALVERILQMDYETEDEHWKAVLHLQNSVLDPKVSSYIYYWDQHFDNEPDAAQIVQRALEYRPIVLDGPHDDDLSGEGGQAGRCC